MTTPRISVCKNCKSQFKAYGTKEYCDNCKSRKPNIAFREFIKGLAKLTNMWHCVYCNKIEDNLEIDHRDGNHCNNDFSNLQLVCRSCNGKKQYGKIKNGSP